MTSLRIGTRGSDLAMWQARDVFNKVTALPDAPALDIIEIKSSGDLNQSVPLWTTPGRGFFTAELDEALVKKQIDIAVHSLKDLATVVADGTHIAAVLEREDPRDALISRDGNDLMGLAKGARLGTSSLRRRAFTANARPDIVGAELRGNVPTRLKKLDDGEYDAIILAAAGLKRLGLESRISARLPMDIFPPAAAQGAVAICVREDDDNAFTWAQALEHKPTRVAVDVERSLLHHLEAGCQAPVGVIATMTDEMLNVYAAVCKLDGSEFISAQADAPLRDSADISVKLAETLLEKGAHSVLQDADDRRQSAAR